LYSASVGIRCAAVLNMPNVISFSSVLISSISEVQRLKLDVVPVDAGFVTSSHVRCAPFLSGGLRSTPRPRRLDLATVPLP